MREIIPPRKERIVPAEYASITFLKGKTYEYDL